MSKNKNLHAARKAKNNEFYTLLSDIENELQHYESHFKGKIVYSNCDSPESNFVKYFTENKERLGIKEFYHTWFDPETGEGSFDSEKSIELLKKADIVVSNPPFSLFRQYIELLDNYNKDYLIVGSLNGYAAKIVFKLYKSGRVRSGITKLSEFIMPDSAPLKGGSYIDKDGKKRAKFGNTIWYTTLTPSIPKRKLNLTREYTIEGYDFITNYSEPVLNVNKIKDIPKDYKGLIGVPISITEYDRVDFDVIDDIIPVVNNKYIYIKEL